METFKLFKGGLHPSNPDRYKFIKGQVSDTRLMGVIAMHLEFKDLLIKDAPSMHQFYYFDCEETGLESLSIEYTDDARHIQRSVVQAFAGLGAKLNGLSEREAVHLVQYMVRDTELKDEPLPDELAEIEWLLNMDIELNTEELEALWAKLCVPVKSDHGVANYFLMRCFGLDLEAAKYLAFPELEIPEAFKRTRCSFLRNRIELLPSTKGEHRMYRCESLIDAGDEANYHVIVSVLEIYKRKLLSAEISADLKISEYEATLMLNRPEYIAVYNIKEPSGDEAEESYYEALDAFTLGMTNHEHPAGTMFMEFKKNNDHAETKLFRLNDDIEALWFLTDSGQMLVAASGQSAIILAETKLVTSGLGRHVALSGHYSFPAPTLFEFAESEYSDFEKYLGDNYGPEN